MLELHFMGVPRVVANETEITGTLSSKAIGILAYLVVNRNEQVARERLASLFWCDSDRKSAKYNLRYALWSINREFRARGIVTDFLHQEDKEHCMLLENHCWYSDVIMLENGPGDQREGAVHYRGEFLQDIPIKGNPELDNWIICERERMQRIFFGRVSQQAEIHQEKGDYASAIGGVESLLAMNPLQEDLHLKLMELYFKNQQRVQAIQQYHKCRDILRRELNISPMPEMKAFFQQILQEESTGAFRVESGATKAREAEKATKATEKEKADADKKTGESEKAPTEERIRAEAAERIRSKDCEELPYDGLSVLMEAIDRQHPQMIDGLPPACLDEISKLLINRRVTGVALSPEIQRLRIYKAVAQVLEQACLKEAPQNLEGLEMSDRLSAEFVKWYRRRLTAGDSKN
ncbi:AfsR/SARP family transcriptional regulator [Anoxynatronum sibiricum]|uniref:BTAD domain-containing putative transcriptional regulator n=1 Tax=Anoxynatronum sibiricum TaxID=210623 RepID=A0ABU9VUK1_9CLOT